MEHTSTINPEQEPNMNRELTIHKMTKLIQLNAETLFNQEGLEDSFAYNNAESVATKLYDEHIVPSGDFSTKNIIHIMTTVNLHESEFREKEAEIDADFQNSVDAAKRICEAKKLKVNTESALYKLNPEDATRVHAETCDDEYRYNLTKLERSRAQEKCVLKMQVEYAIELCEVDLFVRPRDYVKYWDSLMSVIGLTLNAFKFIDDIVNMHFAKRCKKSIDAHYSCLATLDDYVSVHEVLSRRVPVDCLEIHNTM